GPQRLSTRPYGFPVLPNEAHCATEPAAKDKDIGRNLDKPPSVAVPDGLSTFSLLVGRAAFDRYLQDLVQWVHISHHAQYKVPIPGCVVQAIIGREHLKKSARGDDVEVGVERTEGLTCATLVNEYDSFLVAPRLVLKNGHQLQDRGFTQIAGTWC